MISFLLPITIIPTLLMGFTVYQRARNLMLQQVSQRMETFLPESTNQLDSWLLDRSLAIDSLARNEELIERAESFYNMSYTDPEREEARNEAIALIRQVNTPGEVSLFNLFMMVSPSGELLLSTSRTLEGDLIGDKIYFHSKINTNRKANFLELKPSVIYDPNISPSYEISHFLSVPIYGKSDNLIGYLVGISDGRSIQTVLEANSSFLANNNLFLLTEDQKFCRNHRLNQESCPWENSNPATSRWT